MWLVFHFLLLVAGSEGLAPGIFCRNQHKCIKFQKKKLLDQLQYRLHKKGLVWPMMVMASFFPWTNVILEYNVEGLLEKWPKTIASLCNAWIKIGHSFSEIGHSFKMAKTSSSSLTLLCFSQRVSLIRIFIEEKMGTLLILEWKNNYLWSLVIAILTVYIHHYESWSLLEWKQ